MYELQLMPPLVYILHQSLSHTHNSKVSKLPPEDRVVEFGTVLVYSCSASCWSEGDLVNFAQFRQEIVVVQPDLDNVDKLFTDKTF